MNARRAGILLPLFSMRSSSDWGTGDFSSLALWARLAGRHGAKIIQILPVHEMPPEQECPYTALTAFALEPAYIDVSSVEDVLQCGATRKILNSRKTKAELRALNKSAAVDYARVKTLKYKILWEGFRHFQNSPQGRGGARGAEFAEFRRRSGWWLEDYALFRAAKDVFGWSSWTQWEDGLKNRDEAALSAFRARNSEQIEFFEYLQWLADSQLRAARRACSEAGVLLFGDLPFMVSQESADVWSHPGVFDINSEIGAPPDQFSAEGQFWGLPAYRWPEMEADDFKWWRARIRRAREIYDIFRLDHVIGFFRTWVAPKDRAQKPHFDIEDEAAQQRRGGRFLTMVREEAAPGFPVAEDLGVIPPFARETMARLDIPGYKVLRWERGADGSFLKPESYPPVSLAASATHDTDTLRQWWQTMPQDEKAKLWDMLSGGKSAAPAAFSAGARKKLLKRIFAAGSDTAVVLAQDVFGLEGRINIPGTVGPHNWTYRFPKPAEEMESSAKFRAGLETFSRLLGETGR
ncbi:MAG: 4-alpha-glucanotransferase [Elusimicrobiales bacterium]